MNYYEKAAFDEVLFLLAPILFLLLLAFLLGDKDKYEKDEEERIYRKILEDNED